jgi:hypothetical protein
VDGLFSLLSVIVIADDPDQMNDPSWLATWDLNRNEVRRIQDDFVSLSPPDHLIDAHGEYLAAFSTCGNAIASLDEMLALYRDGNLTASREQFNVAEQGLEDCDVQLTRAEDYLRDAVRR